MPEAVALTRIEMNNSDRTSKKRSLLSKIVTAKVILLDGSTLDVNVEVSI